MIADCERGLERPERALALASTPEAATLDREGKVELLLVAAGARRDLGQLEAAVLTLQVPALNSRGPGQWLARLRYAYADALLEVGRTDEARTWFSRAATMDPEGETDAAERVDELDGFRFDEIDVETQPGQATQPGQQPDPAPAGVSYEQPADERPAAAVEAPGEYHS
jgi:tetratricopeptide (TPR) repeat protein